ncbi:MAG: hypothetical protein Q9190_003250 [Brigantiaea leucoxantha]
MTTPAEGFSELDLAKLFGSTFVAPSASGSTSTPRKPKSSRIQHAIIAGSVLGGLVLLVLMMAAFWYFRRNLRRLVLGDITEVQEVDGTGRHAGELPGKSQFWELPSAEPAELWSPIVSETKIIEPEAFKHETSSDKDLGWRGSVSPLELEETAVSPLGSEKTAISPLGSEKTALSPLDSNRTIQVEVTKVPDEESAEDMELEEKELN